MKLIRILSISCLISPAIFLCVLFAPATSLAGLDVRMNLECAAIVQFEELNATLNIKNITGMPFVISDAETDDNAVITFVIERTRNDVLPPLSSRPFVTDLRIDPNEEGKIKIDLSRWYSLSEMGRYIIYANIEWRGKKYSSNAMMIDIVRGMEILKKEYSVPGYDDKIRTFSLRYWRRKQAEFLFLRIDDEDEDMNYGVFRLGIVMQFNKPTIDIDAYGNITVVHQSGPDRFTRSGFKMDGDSIRYIGQCDEKRNGSPYPKPKARILHMKTPVKK